MLRLEHARPCYAWLAAGWLLAGWLLAGRAACQKRGPEPQPSRKNKEPEGGGINNTDIEYQKYMI
jgi:hypothetical protein